MELLLYAILIFLVAAVGGIYMAYRIMSGQLAPWLVSLVHLLLGATGLVLVLLAVLSGTGSVLGWIALGFLLIAALGGFFLASIHLRKKVADPGIVVVHAAAGVIGVLMLLGIAFLFTPISAYTNPDPTKGFVALQPVLTQLA